MLTIQQLQKIKNDDPYSYESFQKIVTALNRGLGLAGIDPMPAAQTDAATAIPPPAPPSGISVTVVGSLAIVILSAPASNNDAVLYFVENSSLADFSDDVATYRLGHSLHLVAVGGPVYWRAYSRYQMSGPSNYTTALAVDTMAPPGLGSKDGRINVSGLPGMAVPKQADGSLDSKEDRAGISGTVWPGGGF